MFPRKRQKKKQIMLHYKHLPSPRQRLKYNRIEQETLEREMKEKRHFKKEKENNVKVIQYSQSSQQKERKGFKKKNSSLQG